jgi:hypothetical protein
MSGKFFRTPKWYTDRNGGGRAHQKNILKCPFSFEKCPSEPGPPQLFEASYAPDCDHLLACSANSRYKIFIYSCSAHWSNSRLDIASLGVKSEANYICENHNRGPRSPWVKYVILMLLKRKLSRLL